MYTPVVLILLVELATYWLTYLTIWSQVRQSVPYQGRLIALASDPLSIEGYTVSHYHVTLLSSFDRLTTHVSVASAIDQIMATITIETNMHHSNIKCEV